MILKYTNSQGKVFELISNGLYRVKTANFHSYAWTVQGVSQKYGIKVENFTKNPYEYNTTIVFKGADRVRKDAINRFHEAMAYDIIVKKPGKLQWREYYIECYITSSSTYPSEKSNQTINDLTILAPYPFWIQEISKTFAAKTQNFLLTSPSYPFDYPFDYELAGSGTALWDNNHYAPSHFKMIIYGPCVSPKVLVNGYPYQIFTELAATEYLIIDSRENTVIKYLTNGATENIYNSRQFEYSVFNKIPGGQVTVNWSGDFSFDIMLYLERSEPKW